MDRGTPEVEGLEAQCASSGNRNACLQTGNTPGLEISGAGFHSGSECDVGGVFGALDGHKCALVVILDGAIMRVLTSGDTKGAADCHEQCTAGDGAALVGEPGAARAGAELLDVLGSGEVEVFTNHVPNTARVCAGVECACGGRPGQALRWAALLHDVAKPACFSLDASGRGHFFGHPEEGARVAGRVMGCLALPKSMTREAQALIRLHDLPVRPVAASCRKMMSLLEAACPGRGRALAFALVDLKRADALAKAPACRGYAVELDAMAARVRAEVAAGCPLTVRELPVGGGDVIRERGLEPGPGVGLVLDALLAAVLAGELGHGREELLAELRMGE